MGALNRISPLLSGSPRKEIMKTRSRLWDRKTDRSALTRSDMYAILKTLVLEGEGFTVSPTYKDALPI